jgi:hypothetical protein
MDADKKPKKKRKCGFCGEEGHTSRGCSKKKAAEET